MSQPDVPELYSLIDGTLARNGKQLSDPIKSELALKKSSSNPLYLDMAVSRLTLLDAEDFAKISEDGGGIEAINSYLSGIISSLPDDLEGMAAELLMAAGEKIDSDMMREAARYIAVSRSGLRSEDITALLRHDGYSMTELNLVQFINYMNDLFIMREDGRFDYMHGCIRSGVLRDSGDITKYHMSISEYLETLPEEDSVRYGELLWHELNSGLYGKAADMLAHLDGQPGYMRSEAAFTVSDALHTEKAEEIIKAFTDSDLDTDKDSLYHLLSDLVLPGLGTTKYDEWIQAALMNGIFRDIDSVRDDKTRSDILLSIAEVGYRFGDRESILISCRRADDAYEILAETDDTKRRLKAINVLLRCAEDCDEKEYSDPLDDIRAAAREVAGRASSLPSDPEIRLLVAETELALSKQILDKRSLYDTLEYLPKLQDTLNTLRKLGEEHPSEKTDRDIIEALSLNAEARDIIGNDRSRAEAEKLYSEAYGIALKRRDRDKNMDSYILFTEASVKYFDYRASNLDKKWGFFSFLNKQDSSSSRDYWIRKTREAAAELNTPRINMMLYRMFRDTGRYDTALEYIEKVKEDIPFYEKEHLLSDLNNAHYSAHRLIYARVENGQLVRIYSNEKEKYEMFDKVYNYVKECCAEADRLAENGDPQYELFRARFYTDLSDLDYSIESVESLTRAEQNLQRSLSFYRSRYSEKGTIESLLDLGLALKLLGLVLESRNGAGDLERARDYFIEMKEIKDRLSGELRAKSISQELMGAKFFLTRVNMKLRKAASAQS
ncbi:MAG: hypothetical protein J5744_05065, partial [Oscillospiraceae bacterium]|nr:hypothetical protein [Oscillospiraceae bacterium]